MKRILPAIFFLFLLVFFVSALRSDGSNCLNDNECESGICQGGKCRAVDILTLQQTSDSCTESWDCTDWGACVNEQKTRTCIDTNSCGTTINKPMESITCTSQETCYDGVQNQGETGVDCGGPCASCETCYDGVQNQGETGVDCGGSCMPCKIAKASSSTFWIIFIIIILIAIVLALVWYFKLRKGVGKIGAQVTSIIKRPPTQPPLQPAQQVRRPVTATRKTKLEQELTKSLTKAKNVLTK